MRNTIPTELQFNALRQITRRTPKLIELQQNSTFWKNLGNKRQHQKKFEKLENIKEANEHNHGRSQKPNYGSAEPSNFSSNSVFVLRNSLNK